MGGGEQGGTSSAQSQQLLDELRRQRTAGQIGQAFQQFGAGVGTQLPYMQQAQGGGQGLPSFGQSQGAQGAQQIAPGVSAALGQLFPQGMGGAGIDEQQLAMILSRLGYGGQGIY